MPAKVTIEAELEVDGKALRVVAVSLFDGVSEVGSALCEATNPHEDTPTPEASAVIGKHADLTLKRSDGSQSRSFVGIVSEVERYLDDETGRFTLRLRIVPRLWKLGKRADCRTFQELSVPDVVKKVLDGAGVTDHELHLAGSYSPRPYIVQYRETDLEFIGRLLAEEGIYFVFKFEGGKDTVVFADDPTGIADIEGTTALPFKHTFGTDASRDIVSEVKQGHVVRSNKVTVRDYDFEKPKLTLEGKDTSKDDGPKSLEVYVYPGRFGTPSEGQKVAKTLLEAIETERRYVDGETGVLSMLPAHRFSIEEHPYEPLNSKYLVMSVEIQMKDPRWIPEGAGDDGDTGHLYSCSFHSIPTAKNALRPPRRDPARRVPGLQTAWTTGPAGSEIYVDSHGRVKVQFHWDRLGKKDDKSSVWLRTMQIPTGGAMYLPRMKWEVSVAYLEGDVDHPLCLSRWYNAASPPPYALPAGKARGSIQTATTPGGGSTNELHTDDTKGSEEMFWNASKDMSIDVNNNCTELVGNNEVHEIGSNHKLNVTDSMLATVGANQTITVGANQTCSVSTFNVEDIAGDHTKTIGANRMMKVGGDHKRTVGGSSKLTVGAMQVDLVVGSISESTPATFTHTVGAALVEMTAKDRSLLVGGSHTETCGAASLIVTKGGHGVEIGGTMMQKVGGAIITKIKGDREDEAGATFTSVAAGAQIIKAVNVVFEAETVLSLVMGASMIIITKASVSIVGTGIKIDGDCAETGALIMDN